ncbi:MAG: serine hydrolase [bacterium]|nr:serine hydrolase [bacterium]
MVKRLAAYVALCALLAPLAVAAQSAPPSSAPAPVPTPADVQALIEARVHDHPGTGIVVGTIDRGVVREYLAGSAGNARPLDEHTLFEIGSVTKTFTATVLAELVQRGRVHLDDPVQRYLPTSVHVPSRDGKQITLLNLAEQRSGLPRMPSNFAKHADSSDPYASYSVTQLYHFLSGYTLPRDPGASFEYSNLGIGLLGLALARVERRDYATMVRDEVWKPLGMSETRIALAPADRARFAIGHDDANLPVHSWEFTDALAGAGAIRSDLHDMLRYLGAAMGHGPLGGAMRFAERPRAPLASNLRIGLVWWTDDKHRLIEHEGDTAGYHSIVMMTADRSRGVVAMSNGPEVADIAGRILDPSYPLTPQMHAAALSDDVLSEYVGTYANPAAGLTYKITRDGRQLIARIVGQPAAPILASSEDHFFYTEVAAYIEFVRQHGRVVGLILTQNGAHTPAYRLGSDGKPLASHLEPAYPPVVALDAATLAGYVGTYVDDGLAFTVTVKNGTLYTALRTHPAYPVFASAKDAFYYRVVQASITFTRDAQGRVSALTLHQNGREITFVKTP